MKTPAAGGPAHRAVPPGPPPSKYQCQGHSDAQDHQPRPALGPAVQIPAVGGWGEVQQAPWLGLLGFPSGWVLLPKGDVGWTGQVTEKGHSLL